MDSVEFPHFRQHAFLQSQPVRRTPILHNFLQVISSRNSSLQSTDPQLAVPPESVPASERSRPPYHGCVQHLGLTCYCSLCSASPVSSPPNRDPPGSSSQSQTSTFSSARTEPRLPTESRSGNRPSPFGSAFVWGNSLRTMSAASGRRNAATLGRVSEAMSRHGVLPPRTSASSSSLLSVLRQQESPSRSSVYTSASASGSGTHISSSSHVSGSRASSRMHHPLRDGGHTNPSSARDALQCNLSRYLLGRPPSGAGDSQEQETLLNNNMDPEASQDQLLPGSDNSLEQAGPSQYQTPSSLEGHLNHCRVCHNLFTYNQARRRWERTQQAPPRQEEAPPWRDPSPTLHNVTPPAPPEHHAALVMEPSVDVPGPESAFTRDVASDLSTEQTVGLVYNPETDQWERVYSQTATPHSERVSQNALNQEMPEDTPDDDYLRR